jgi:GrpB-like predicted nucleotidyltransferase (UPF0157 family)
VHNTFRIAQPDGLEQATRETLEQVRSAAPFAEVFEVGSTAVPGVLGKGDLDFLVRTPAPQFPRLLAALDRRFARNPGQFSSPIYQGYVLPGPLDIALQCTVTGGPHDDFLPFLAALRTDPNLVRAYNELKRQFDGQPMDVYRTAKAAFIEGVLHGV